MKRLAFLFEYDGSLFLGYQRQTTGPTVQGCFEAALAGIVGQPVRLTAAGRTDRGVHALGQVATADASTKVPVDVLTRLLNKALKPGIRVRRTWWAPEDFHPRHDALRRVYRYVVFEGAEPSVFLARQSWQLDRPLDRVRMTQACEALKGPRNFVSFCLKPDEAVRLQRTLDEARLLPIEGGFMLEFVSRAFLRGQVRHMVGAIVAVGAGRMHLDDLQRMLHAQSKVESPVPAPPEGLYLVQVDYPPGKAA